MEIKYSVKNTLLLDALIHHNKPTHVSISKIALITKQLDFML